MRRDGLGGASLAVSVYVIAARRSRPQSADIRCLTKNGVPIVQVHCDGCHADGGIGGFVFDEDNVAALSDLMARRALAREMPPWPPGGDSPPLHGDRRLTDAQIETLGAWAAAGAQLGDPADHQERSPRRTFEAIRYLVDQRRL